MYITTLCRPCAEKIGEFYEITRIITKVEKVTCDECKRRRYANKYRLGKKKSSEANK